MNKTCFPGVKQHRSVSTNQISAQREAARYVAPATPKRNLSLNRPITEEES